MLGSRGLSTLPPTAPGATRCTWVLAVGAGAMALALTSCGLGSSGPRAVTQDFVRAMSEHDWEAACQDLSHDFIHRNMNGNSRYCTHYLEQWHTSSTFYDSMTVPQQELETRSDGTLVTVDLSDGSTDEARVVDEGGELKLARYPGQDRAAR